MRQNVIIITALWAVSMTGWSYFCVATDSGDLANRILLIVWGGLALLAAAIDAVEFRIPDIITLPGTLLIVLAQAGIGNAAYSLTGALAGSGVIYLIRAAHQRITGKTGIGLGDVKLMLLLGAAVGPYGAIITLLWATVFASLVGVLSSFVMRVSPRNICIAMGPFLTFASMLSAARELNLS